MGATENSDGKKEIKNEKVFANDTSKNEGVFVMCSVTYSNNDNPSIPVIFSH